MACMKWMRLKLIICADMVREFHTFEMWVWEVRSPRQAALEYKKILHGNGMHAACFSMNLQSTDLIICKHRNTYHFFSYARIAFAWNAL